MTSAEILFMVVTSTLLLIGAIMVKNIPWGKLGFAPKELLRGWWQVLLFNIAILVLLQLNFYFNVIELPAWMTDKDLIFGLIAITFLQEILFRGLLISYLERFGERKALWISVSIFVLFHLIAPYSWSIVGISFAGLTLLAGYFWGWHFLKFRNIYLLGISHFLVNLSFNYVLFTISG